MQILTPWMRVDESALAHAFGEDAAEALVVEARDLLAGLVAGRPPFQDKELDPPLNFARSFRVDLPDEFLALAPPVSMDPVPRFRLVYRRYSIQGRPGSGSTPVLMVLSLAHRRDARPYQLASQCMGLRSP